MKRATSDTRIRIEISLDGVHKAEPITMTAGQWNGVSIALSEAARRMNSMECDALAKQYRKAANRITAVLVMKRYFDADACKTIADDLKCTDPDLYEMFGTKFEEE